MTGARITHLLVMVTLATLALPSPSFAEDDKSRALQWLRARIAALARDPRIEPAVVGVAAVDVPSGRPLVQVRAKDQFNVASNVKLITSAAALTTLGPEYSFKTALYAPDREGEVVRGDLYLKGFGSPTLSESDLWQMTRDLYDTGIRSVRGQLVIDESYFDDQREAPLFDSKKTDAWYRPPNGALSLNGNCVSVQVRPADMAGQPALVVLRPRSAHLRLDNRTLTVSGLRRTWIKVQTRPRKDHTEVRVRGRVRLGFRDRPFRRRIEDPGMMTGYALLHALARRGIQVRGKRVKRGRTPAQIEALVTHPSTSLALMLYAMNKYSSNFVAEQLLKVLGAEVFGAPATWEKGLKAVAQYLRQIGIRPGTYTMKNGSGLYDATRFSPEQIVRVLRQVYLSFRTGVDFVTTLAIAGVDGTLQHRFLGSSAERYVRAKTGTLASVVTLSGFAGTSKQRGPLAFSILINDLPAGKISKARAVADEMATAMVTYLEQ